MMCLQVFNNFKIVSWTKRLPVQILCLKAYRDLKNSLDWAKEKGFAEGYVEIRLKILMLEYGKTREEALVKIAKELLEKNVSTQAIYMTTGISVEDI